MKNQTIHNLRIPKQGNDQHKIQKGYYLKQVEMLKDEIVYVLHTHFDMYKICHSK